MVEKKPLLEVLEELHKQVETQTRLGTYVTASHTANLLLEHGDWHGFRVLQDIKKSQEGKVASFYADFYMKKNRRFEIIQSLYTDKRGLIDILSLSRKFGDCTELNTAMEQADYSHYLIAFEFVLGAARKLGLTERRKEFLRAYADRLGLYSTSVGFYGLESK